jgi:hypothetical protein
MLDRFGVARPGGTKINRNSGERVDIGFELPLRFGRAVQPG